MKKILMTFAAAMILTGCSKPTIDTTSKETFEASMEEIAKDMTKQEKEKLVSAIAIITINASFKDGDEASAEKALSTTIHGKTADEILELAASMKNTAK